MRQWWIGKLDIEIYTIIKETNDDQGHKKMNKITTYRIECKKRDKNNYDKWKEIKMFLNIWRKLKLKK